MDEKNKEKVIEIKDENKKELEKQNENGNENLNEVIDKYNKKVSIYRFLSIALAIICYIVFSAALKNFSQNGFSKLDNKNSNKAEEITNKDMKNLQKTIELLDPVVRGAFLNQEKIDKNKQLTWAIKGYIAGLGDEYTNYMTSEEYKEFINNLDGKLVGIGVAMQKTEEGVKLVKVFEDSPAIKSGIKEGDILLEANGENVAELNLDEISKKVRGEEGTKVNIKVLREAEKLDFEIERKVVNIKYVSGKILEEGIGYIKLDQFGEEAYKVFKEEYDKLKNQGMQKLILDLRSNTGGELENAKNIIDMFLPKDKLIFSTRDAHNNKVEEKTRKGVYANNKLVILGDGYSASASELLIAALVDNNRAEFVGKNTYGKGVIQELKQLKNGDFLKITTHEYLRPNGETIHKKGVKPNVEVDLDVELYRKDKTDTQLNKALELIKNK